MRTGIDPARVSRAAVRKTLDLPSVLLSAPDSKVRFPRLELLLATPRSAMLLTKLANLHPFRMQSRTMDNPQADLWKMNILNDIPRLPRGEEIVLLSVFDVTAFGVSQSRCALSPGDNRKVPRPMSPA